MPPKIPYKQVKINFIPEHFSKLEELAEAKGLSKADWIRQKLGLEYAEARQPIDKPSIKAVDPVVVSELRHIGRNINQIATYANLKKVLDREILSALIRVENKLKALL